MTDDRLSLDDLASSEATSHTIAMRGEWPARYGREEEAQLLDLIVADDRRAERWLAVGSPFFMAGLALMLANVLPEDEASYRRLAAELDPTIGEVASFQRWLDQGPVRPSRFVPLVRAQLRHANGHR